MKPLVIFATLSAIMLLMMPVDMQARPADDCMRIGAYVDRVMNKIDRATPVIRQSGSERAVVLLESAIGNIRAANRALAAGQCRMAFNLAQQAERQVEQALRLTNIRPRD